MGTQSDPGKEFAEIWGEAVASARHLRLFTLVLGGVAFLLLVVVVRLAGVDAPNPIVIRVDEVGRAEALAYEMVEAQADPLDPTTKYFLNQFLTDYYSRQDGDGANRVGSRPALPDRGSRQRGLPDGQRKRGGRRGRRDRRGAPGTGGRAPDPTTA